MLIKTDNVKDMWTICTRCGGAVKAGKSCGCGNVKVSELKNGVVQVEAEDSDSVVYGTGRLGPSLAATLEPNSALRLVDLGHDPARIAPGPGVRLPTVRPPLAVPPR